MSIQARAQKYIMNTYARKEPCFVRGEGATCFDEKQKAYIDFGSGIGVNALGYCDRDWQQAVATQSATLQHTSNLYYTEPMVKVAETLCKRSGYAKVFFGNSGAEANEGAIKLARKYSADRYGAKQNRSKILSLVNSFHGRTITTLAATGQAVFHQSFHPFTSGFDYVVANDFEAFLEKADDSVCAVLLEFVQGEGGVNPLDAAYVQEVFRYCQAHDILVIADEVQTGIGRTGKFLASEHYQVQPDITTLAKGLGGGLPIGAFLCNQKLADCFQPGDHGTTFGGNPVVCAGAQVVLDKVDQILLTAVLEKEIFIRKYLAEAPEIVQIDGLGLMLGIQLKTKQASVILEKCLAKGLILLTAKEKIRLLPPLTVSIEELTKGLEILLEVLNETKEGEPI
ncbi:acetylornithine/succinylornithine family transaminase [Enterococcus sp. LJL98]